MTGPGQNNPDPARPRVVGEPPTTAVHDRVLDPAYNGDPTRPREIDQIWAYIRNRTDVGPDLIDLLVVASIIPYCAGSRTRSCTAVVGD